jgi:hypothetical protein
LFYKVNTILAKLKDGSSKETPIKKKDQPPAQEG